MTPERKPCPFCGSAETHTTSSGEGVVYVECAECGACGCSSDAVDGAADAWNTRASLAQPASTKERWNIERDGDALLVCFNDHEKGEACRYERFVPEAQPASVPAWFDEPFVAEGLKSLGLTVPTPREFGETIARRYRARITELELKLAAPQPEAQPSMTPEQVRDGIADWIETNVNHREFWTPEVADLIRSIEIRPEAYAHRAAPSAQAEQGGK